MKNIAVIYHNYPHYREGIVRELVSSEKYHFHFIGSDIALDPSIELMQFPPGIKLLPARLLRVGPFIWQRGLYRYFSSNKYDAYIFLGNPYILTYWIYGALLRVIRNPVLFWTHGWINSHEGGIKRFIRNLHARIAHGLLLYGDRAKKIGMRYGFRAEHLHVLYNSLNDRELSAVYNQVQKIDRLTLKQSHKFGADTSIVICSARLTYACKFHLLLTAASILTKRGHKLRILLVGDGPARRSLETLARQLSVPLALIGACYDEWLIAQYYYISDVTVSPGKVGLTAIHSLLYGTPVITHDRFDEQMPEYEAISEGETGDFFKADDSSDLADRLEKWLFVKDRNPDIMDKCTESVGRLYSTRNQLRVIENALDLELRSSC